MNKVLILAELPTELTAPARTFVKESWASDLDELLTDALRRFLEPHSSRVTEAFIMEDLQWGFMVMSDHRPPLVVCDAGPLIHLDEVGALDLLEDFAEVLVPEAVWAEGGAAPARCSVPPRRDAAPNYATDAGSA